jgi:hypothetical protein
MNKFRPQPSWNFGFPNVASVTRPLVLFRTFYNACPYRIKVNISGKHSGILAFLDEDRLESPLEKMPGSFSFDVEVCGIGSVHVVHYLRQIAARRLQK